MRRLRRIFLRLTALLVSLLPFVVGLSIKSGHNGGNGRPKTIIFSTPSQPFDVVASTVSTPESGKNEDAASRKARVSAKKSAAPLVDSTLLRFMSAQKKQQQKEVKAKAVTTPTPGFLASLMEGLTRDEEKAAEATADIKAEDTSQFWLGQYNRNRVAKKLIEMGVENTLAYDAGEVIQEHVLARTARRRVRAFLKERDALWEKDQDGERIESIVTDTRQKEASKPSIPQYGLDDVIELFVEFGLTGNDIAAIFAHTPSVALMRPRRSTLAETINEDGDSVEFNGEVLEDTLTRSFKKLLLGELKLRKYDARKILRTCPGLLTMRGSRSSEQVVKLFVSLGVSAKSLAKGKNGLPVLLSRSPADLFRIVAFLTSNAVRMPIQNIGPLLRRKVSYELLDALAPVSRKPSLPSNSSEIPLATLWGGNSEERREQMNSAYRKMATNAWTLRHEIGCANLGKIISSYPNVLFLNATEQILPNAEYLMNELGIWKDDLPRVLQLYPTLLGLDVSQMRHVVSYLESIGVEEDALPSIFRAFPAILTLDVEKDMVPVVEFLSDIGVANIGRFVTRLPPVLGYSIERELLPKWKYLSEVCLYSGFELSRFPAYFSYPFDRVIKTRYEYLRDVKRVPTQLLAVDRILRFGDKDFATLVARDEDGGASFQRFVKERNAKRPYAKRKRPARNASQQRKRTGRQ